VGPQATLGSVTRGPRLQSQPDSTPSYTGQANNDQFKPRSLNEETMGGSDCCAESCCSSASHHLAGAPLLLSLRDDGCSTGAVEEQNWCGVNCEWDCMESCDVRRHGQLQMTPPRPCACVCSCAHRAADGTLVGASARALGFWCDLCTHNLAKYTKPTYAVPYVHGTVVPSDDC